jgi:hypothetical protein
MLVAALGVDRRLLFMKDRALFWAVGVGVVGVVGACDQLNDLFGREMACTLIGCADSFNVTIKPRAGEFPVGTHEVVITADGKPERTCTFKFPFSGSIESGQCNDPGGIMLTVTPLQDCKTTTQGDSVSQSCTPIPGKFQEGLSVFGLPGKVRVTQRVAGQAPYLDREATPGYQDVYPNGKDCGAVCKQAAADWEF